MDIAILAHGVFRTFLNSHVQAHLSGFFWAPRFKTSIQCMSNMLLMKHCNLEHYALNDLLVLQITNTFASRALQVLSYLFYWVDATTFGSVGQQMPGESQKQICPKEYTSRRKYCSWAEENNFSPKHGSMSKSACIKRSIATMALEKESTFCSGGLEWRSPPRQPRRERHGVVSFCWESHRRLPPPGSPPSFPATQQLKIRDILISVQQHFLQSLVYINEMNIWKEFGDSQYMGSSGTLNIWPESINPPDLHHFYVFFSQGSSPHIPERLNHLNAPKFIWTWKLSVLAHSP